MPGHCGVYLGGRTESFWGWTQRVQITPGKNRCEYARKNIQGRLLLGKTKPILGVHYRTVHPYRTPKNHNRVYTIKETHIGEQHCRKPRAPQFVFDNGERAVDKTNFMQAPLAKIGHKDVSAPCGLVSTRVLCPAAQPGLLTRGYFRAR